MIRSLIPSFVMATAMLSSLTVARAGEIFGSGVNANLTTTFQRDSNWKIVALPSGAAGAGIGATPYDAYVPRTVEASIWLGGNTGPNGSQGGYFDSASNQHLYWISPSETTAAIVTGVDANTPSTWYRWIAAQTFTVPESRTWYFNFPAAVDNRLGFFINGTIDTTDPRQPTITGGTQIGTTSTAPGQFLQISNNIGEAFLEAGTHTAYMVLTDLGNQTGVLIGSSVFQSTPIPEPSTYVLAAIASGTLAMMARRRRGKRATG